MTTGSNDEPGQDNNMLLKSIQLSSIDEVRKIEEDLAKRTIIILRVTPLAQKSIDELKTAVERLYEFATSIGGDIARLGEERIVITPPDVRIWRERQP